MRTKQLIIIAIVLQLIASTTIYAQFCGIKDPSIERYTTCPTTHSQLFLKSYHWFNILNPIISTSDYYNEGSFCNFGGFIASGGIQISYCSSCFRNSCNNTFYPGCGRAGIFINYTDGSQDPKYKEYIGTRVDLVAGRNYNLSIDIQRSNHSSSNTLQRDLAIFGYNGPLPASQAGFCISGAVPLDTISKSLFDNDSNNTIISNFICPGNFSYLILGAVCDGANATAVGYVYLDKILLSDSRDSTLTPWIKFAGQESRACCFSGSKNEFQLVGNKAPIGTNILWSQKSTNPQLLSFTTPNDTITRITGSGYLTVGVYDFYYTWTKNGCSMTDTISVNVINNARANAGIDFTVCNDSTFSMNATSPTLAEINTRGYLSWWSIVDSSKPGGIYHFPLSNPAAQNCLTGPGALSYTLNYTSSMLNLPNAVFQNRHQSDTFQLIWNIVDDCNIFSSDTVKVYIYNFKIKSDTLTICPGDTTSLIFEAIDDSIYNSNHINRANYNYTWSITNDTGSAQIIGGIHNDSIRVTSITPGAYEIRYDVYDSTNHLCNHYINSLYVYVRDSAKILHPNNIVVCGQGSFQIVQAYVPLNIEWWWDIIDESEPDSIFTLYNTDYQYLPNDGDSNSNVRMPVRTDSSNSFTSTNYTIFTFPLIMPQDTFTLIYNVRNSCYPFTIKKDTVTVITNYLNISGAPSISCPGDTSLILFENGVPIRVNSRSDTSLHYFWYQIAGPSTMIFDSLSTRDSVICTVNNVPGNYTAGLRVFDSDDTICPNLYSTYSFTILNPVLFTSVNAGVDINVCNSLLTPYSLIMNATPSIATLNASGYQSWWSVIDYAQPDSEYIFISGCVPADGFDNGNITCGYDLNCGNVLSYSSDAPNCFFAIDNWGCYDFIWHVQYQCNGVNYYKDDTVKFCWDYLEPFANAGHDDTATCNVVQLIGNTSAASAANNGCFLWRQINSTTGNHIQIADSTNNIAYLIGLDTVASGTYYFEYTIGCGVCSKNDTVAIFIPPSLPRPNISLSSNASDIYLCKDDSVTIIATGADQYQFFVNGLSVGNLSSNNSYTNGRWQIDTNSILVIGYDASLNCYSSSDTSIIFILHSLDSLKINKDSILFCAGSTTYLSGTTPYTSQRIYWYSAADNFTTPINLPNGTVSGDSIAISPINPTIYKAVLYDSLAHCWGTDSMIVKVFPIVTSLPDPSLQADTSICSYDSISIPIIVSNQLYTGYWSSYSTSSVHIQDINNPITSLNASIGNHIIVWTESNLGCVNSDSFVLQVIAYPIVDAGVDTTICKGKQLQLYAQGDAENYIWTPIDSVLNSDQLDSKTKKIYNEIILVLEGYNGICAAIDSIEIVIVECPSDIKVPNAFSPNGDGNNDYFSVFTYKMKNYEIWIFNRWGENVYYTNNLNETNDLNKGWNGIYNGAIQDVGVYVYLIKAVNIYNENIELKGNITLIK